MSRGAGPKTVGAVPDDARERLDALGRENPEWRPWLALLEETIRAVHDPAWQLAVPDMPDRRGLTGTAPSPPPTGRPRDGAVAGAPLLAGATLLIERQLTEAWVQRLLAVAAASGGPGASSLTAARARQLDSSALLAAAVCQEDAVLARLASAAGTDARALTTVAHLAAMPLLQACGRLLARRAPDAWSHGYCPICGAWPALAELRGLDQARRLRCSRCGADWGIERLRCPYCDTADHEQLASLLPEGRLETRRVDTCHACHGYLKALAALRPSPGYRVALEDLATVDLDIVALERGYTRRDGPGFPLHARLVEPGASPPSSGGPAG